MNDYPSRETLASITAYNTDDLKRENANINAEAPMGIMLKYGSETAKAWNLAHVLDPEIAELHKRGDLHIHDLDFYHTFNCVLPHTKVILSSYNNERQVSLEDQFPLLGLGTHKITDTWIHSRNGFVELQYLHVRDADELVYRFTTEYHELECTGDHILPVIRDGQELELRASEIKQTDSLIIIHTRYSWNDLNKNDTGKIIMIEKYRYKGRVYDLTTADEHFVANGILSHNCSFIPLGKLLKEGFRTGHGSIRSPSSIGSAAALACIILQSNQNDMFR